MGSIRISQINVSPEIFYVRHDLEVDCRIQSHEPLQDNVEAAIHCWLKSPGQEFYLGALTVKWKNNYEGNAVFSWIPSQGKGRYQVVCQAEWKALNGNIEWSPPAAFPRLIQIMPAPPEDYFPPEWITRPRGERSKLPYSASNIAGTESFGLAFDTKETGYPLAEFFPKRPGVEDPNAPLTEGPAKALYAETISRVDAGIRNRVDPGTGLLKEDQIFFAVYHRTSKGFVAVDQQQKSSELVRAGIQRLGVDKQDQEKKISLFRDAIELDPNNLQAYLEIVKVCVTQSIETDFARGRRYYLNLFFRLRSTVAFLEPALKHGEPERPSAFHIWNKACVLMANQMEAITRVRRAHGNYPTLGFINEFHALADTLGLKSLLPMNDLSQNALSWLHLSATERFSREELLLLAPNLQHLPLSDYFRRRFQVNYPNGVAYGYGIAMHRWMWKLLWEQFTPLRYTPDPRAVTLQHWIDYIGSPAEEWAGP